MRHVFHRIFERYLNSEQAAFDTSPRELWPQAQFEPRPRTAGSGGGLAERGGGKRILGELEPHN